VNKLKLILHCVKATLDEIRPSETVSKINLVDLAGR